MTRIAAVTGGAALALLVPLAAAAHPGLRPGEVAAGARNQAEIVIPHGCGAEGGMPEEGTEASPTVEVAVQWVEGVTFAAPPVDGWDATSDGEATTWTDAGGATLDPILLPVDIDVSADVAPGELHLSVYQECENGESFRWQAQPGQDGSPAMRMTVLQVGSPPAEREGQHAEPTPTQDHTDHGGSESASEPDDTPDSSESDHTMEGSEPEASEMAAGEPTAMASAVEDDAIMDATDSAIGATVQAAAEDEAGGSTGVYAGLGGLVVVLGAAWLHVRSRGAAPTA